MQGFFVMERPVAEAIKTFMQKSLRILRIFTDLNLCSTAFGVHRPWMAIHAALFLLEPCDLFRESFRGFSIRAITKDAPFLYIIKKIHTDPSAMMLNFLVLHTIPFAFS